MSTVSKTNKKPMLPPINLIFKYLQQQSLVTIWLFEQTQSRIQGKIRGFDEFMNIVIDDAKEISTEDGSSEALGRILLKGDNITLISSLDI
ncbi:Piso0_001025 [Millerozyma farinosa CBS 7064]|uniref:Small nuclear ribonucleoprotein E n=1 Tax=Pichia sorbitophila (strain ATCC MYA-4447 / BCRC 22081 / CBS 7064 / NBRC 10061 / NRRL Y-12695) TaxID=559304 RepID=G8YS65_PICSO|nr:Piso0_001025 [Millerozyma farinosa CBS 7064]CCE78988.1 Piso0_001025 [Millerozyma farinosa CBS 7064]